MKGLGWLSRHWKGISGGIVAIVLGATAIGKGDPLAGTMRVVDGVNQIIQEIVGDSTPDTSKILQAIEPGASN